MDNTLRLKFDPLSDDNYEIWSAHIRDKLLVENLEDIFVCSEIEAGEDGHQVTIPTAANAAAAKRAKIRGIWSFIRNHLSSEIYTKTLDETEVTFGDPVSLLRYLRKNWHNNSVFDRSNIRETFESLTLETCKDMDDFVVQFKRQRALMSKYGVNLLSTDEDALYAFHKKLPVAYKDKQLQ
jgi:hypothetical protein